MGREYEQGGWRDTPIPSLVRFLSRILDIRDPRDCANSPGAWTNLDKRSDTWSLPRPRGFARFLAATGNCGPITPSADAPAITTPRPTSLSALSASAGRDCTGTTAPAVAGSIASTIPAVPSALLPDAGGSSGRRIPSVAALITPSSRWSGLNVPSTGAVAASSRAMLSAGARSTGLSGGLPMSPCAGSPAAESCCGQTTRPGTASGTIKPCVMPTTASITSSIRLQCGSAHGGGLQRTPNPRRLPPPVAASVPRSAWMTSTGCFPRCVAAPSSTTRASTAARPRRTTSTTSSPSSRGVLTIGKIWSDLAAAATCARAARCAERRSYFSAEADFALGGVALCLLLQLLPN
jgi:hypothetical protein